MQKIRLIIREVVVQLSKKVFDNCQDIPLILRTELLNGKGSKKPKFDNKSENFVLLTNSTLIGSSNFSEAIECVQSYLMTNDYVFANFSKIKPVYYAASDIPADNNQVLFVRTSEQSVDSSVVKEKIPFISQFSCTNRDIDGLLSLTNSNSLWEKNIMNHGLYLSKVKGCPIDNLSAVMVDVGAFFISKPANKPVAMPKITLEKSFPYLARVEVKSKCTYSEQSKSNETSDNLIRTTFSVYVDISDLKSTACMYDTFRTIVLQHILSLETADKSKCLRVSRNAKMYEIPSRGRKAVGGQINDTESLISAIISGKRSFIDSNYKT